MSWLRWKDVTFTKTATLTEEYGLLHVFSAIIHYKHEKANDQMGSRVGVFDPTGHGEFVQDLAKVCVCVSLCLWSNVSLAGICMMCLFRCGCAS